MEASSKCRIRESNSRPHVGVVGAGIAGLCCADVLLRSGFQVTVIEGRDRVGGRLHQEKLPNGHWVDLGPNWIHGPKDNPILDLVNKTGTDVGSWDERSYIFDDLGKLFPVSEGERHSNIMWTIIQDAFVYSNSLSNEISGTRSLQDFFVEKLTERIPETEENWQERRKIVMQISELWGAFTGSPIARQSLKFFWLEESIEGENLFCAGTYKKTLELMAQPALSGANMKFNTKAERISYRMDPGEQTRIHTDNGEVLEFDEVVVTAPLGWLKSHLDAFEPALPARLSKAIGSISYGCLEKAYITFPKAFWRTEDEDDPKVEGFIQWLSPSYAPDTNPDRWYQEVVELANLTPSASHPTLLFYMYGEQSHYMTSKVSAMASEKERVEFLTNFFEPYYSRLPHFSAAAAECQPTGCLSTDWLHDELAGNGSYTNFQVGLEDGDGDIKEMREGLPEQGLWLAGEHTSPFAVLGTATGAYWSGESVGKRIAEAYGMASR